MTLLHTVRKTISYVLSDETNSKDKLNTKRRRRSRQVASCDNEATNHSYVQDISGANYEFEIEEIASTIEKIDQFYKN